MVKVSIIVPIYNVEKYLDRCMSSLLNQTLKDIEIIMVDDESPDNCPQMCDDYAKKDRRIKVVHKKNGGLGFARNSGLEIATGEYVAFVDSDDFVDVEMYEKLYSIASTNDSDIVFCGFNSFENGQIVEGKSEVKSLTTYKNKNCEGVLLGMVNNCGDKKSIVKYEMSVWHGIYKHQVMLDNGISFCSERKFISEDIIFHIDFIKHCQVISFIPDRFYYYCYNEESLTKTYRKERLGRHLILFDEIKRRILANNYSFDISKVSNLFLLKLRYDFTIIGSYGFSLLVVRNHVRDLVNDKRLIEFLKNVSFKDIPIRYSLFFNLIKMKWTSLLTLLIYK